MNDPLQQGTLIVLGCTGVLIVFALLCASYQGKRDRDLALLAAEMGFSFKPEDPALARELFGPVADLQVKNAMRGEAQGLKLFVFDMHTFLYSDSKVVTDKPIVLGQIRITVLAFLDDTVAWPRFSLHPRRQRRILNRPIGQGAELFEEDKTFYGPISLTAREVSEVTRMFTDKVRADFVQNGEQWVEADGSLLFYSQGRLIPADGLRAFLESGFTVKRLLETGDERPA